MDDICDSTGLNGPFLWWGCLASFITLVWFLFPDHFQRDIEYFDAVLC